MLFWRMAQGETDLFFCEHDNRENGNILAVFLVCHGESENFFRYTLNCNGRLNLMYVEKSKVFF